MNNQDDLQDDSKKDGLDPKLQQLYRKLPKEQPSPEVDAKILAAAKIITANKNQKKSHHWQAPFALAASVILVSSVALYLHQENPTAFDASVPAVQAPIIKMTKPSINDEVKVNKNVMAKFLADQKSSPQNAKDSPITQPNDESMASAQDLNDHRSTALAGKKADIDRRADQIAKIIQNNKSEKISQSAAVAKEQATRQAETEVAHKEMHHFTAEAFSPAPMAAPAPIMAPAPRMLPQAETSELNALKTEQLKDTHRSNGQLSVANTESDKPVVLEKSNASPVMAAPPKSVASTLTALAGAAVTMAQPIDKQLAQRDESRAKTDVMQNISTPVMSIEGIALGMSREQLEVQGMTCYVDVCHLELSQPKQATYWGMPATNAHLTAFLRSHIVTKLLLEQKNAQLNQVKIALSNVGIASQQSCTKEKTETLLIGRQLGTNIFNVRSIDSGLSLTICQKTKPVDQP